MPDFLIFPRGGGFSYCSLQETAGERKIFAPTSGINIVVLVRYLRVSYHGNREAQVGPYILCGSLGNIGGVLFGILIGENAPYMPRISRLIKVAY